MQQFRIVTVNPAMARTRLRSLLPEHVQKKESRLILAALAPDTLVAGVLVLGYDRGSLCIDYLFVENRYRRKGVGRALLDSFVETAAKNRFFPIVALFVGDTEHAGLEALLLSQGHFIIERMPRVFRIPPSQREGSEVYQLLLKEDQPVLKFYEMSAAAQNEFRVRLLKRHVPYLMPLESEDDYEQDLCFCTAKSDRIESVLFVSVNSKDEVLLRYIYAKDSEGIVPIFSAFAKRMEAEYAGADLMFEASSAVAQKLMQTIFGIEPGPRDLCVARWDGTV